MLTVSVGDLVEAFTTLQDQVAESVAVLLAVAESLSMDAEYMTSLGGDGETLLSLSREIQAEANRLCDRLDDCCLEGE